MHTRIAGVGGVIVAFFVTGCGQEPSLSRTPVPLDAAALVLLSDRQISGLGRIDIDGSMIEIPDLALGSDPALGGSGDDVFVIARDAQVIYEVDPTKLLFGRTFVPYADAELDQPFVTSCGQTTGTNPQDVDVDADGRLWVPRYDKPDVAIINADRSFSGTVDLSSLADADKLPEAAAVRVVDDHAYVTIQRLDRCEDYAPTAPGLIARIDIAKREVVGTIELGGRNPFGRMVSAPWDLSGNTIAVALPGDFFSIEDGDAATIVNLASGEVTGFGRESEIGGSVSEVVLAAPDEAYMIVSDPKLPQTATHVVRINPQTGELGSTLLDSHDELGIDGGYCHLGLTIVGEQVLVGSRAPCEVGIAVFDRKSLSKLGVIHPAKLSPVSLQALP